MGKPAYRIIMEDLSAEIASGALPAGARVPALRELEARYGVSQITVLRVFKELSAQGKIRRNGGNGYQVTPPEKSSNTVFCAFRPLYPVNSDDNYGNRILHGIMNGCLQNHLSLLIPVAAAECGAVELSDAGARRIADELAGFQHPAGVLLDMRFSDRQIREFILPAAGEAPVVLAGRRTKLPLPFAAVPTERCGADAALLALKSGAEFFSLQRCFGVFDDAVLFAALRASLLKNGVPPGQMEESDGAHRSDLRNRQLLDHSLALMKRGKKVCFFAGSDYWARPLCSALEEAGFRAGSDYSLISYGGFELSYNASPRLCSIHIDAESIGFRAAALLAGRGQPGAPAPEVTYRIELNDTL